MGVRSPAGIGNFHFNFRANITAAGFLPDHSAVFGDLLDVLIPPRRSGFGGRANGRGRTWRNDDRRVRMTLGDRLIYSVLIVSSVSSERRDRISDLVEEPASPRGVIDRFPGQFNCNDLTALGIDTYV
jgi:hypothetical protein